MHAVLHDQQRSIAAMARRFGVRRLEVVGSAACSLDFDPLASDFDFLFSFANDAGLAPLDQYCGLRDALAELLGRPVELIEADAVTNPMCGATSTRHGRWCLRRDRGGLAHDAICCADSSVIARGKKSELSAASARFVMRPSQAKQAKPSKLKSRRER